jgi:hypothetical protein
MMRCVYGVLGLGLLTFGAGNAQPGRVNPANYGWHTSLDSARAAAKKSGKPLMVVFRCEP